MGHVKVKARIWDIEKTKSKEIDGIVDTGATLSVIPEKIAGELDWKKLENQKLGLEMVKSN